jgi:hypothetical protein
VPEQLVDACVEEVESIGMGHQSQGVEVAATDLAGLEGSGQLWVAAQELCAGHDAPGLGRPQAGPVPKP